jgi:hypothetical protein
MYRVFIPVGPLPLSSVSALVPRFAPSGAEPIPMPAELPPQAHPKAHLSWVALAIPIATAMTIPSGARGKYNRMQAYMQAEMERILQLSLSSSVEYCQH